ncbi:MAG: zf-TFIIB domain-containing protein [Thermoleophilia bacterium]|nr:zf-TFIIB domain-containing protein [Thermoleophilia bacterium]
MTAARTCPDCSAALEVVHHEGIELDRCPAGHGTWLDRGELRAVANTELAPRPVEEAQAAVTAAARDAGHAVLAEADRQRRRCPICGAAMRLTEYATSGIVIDECSEHGVWLDAGELEQVEAYAEGVRRELHSGAGNKPLIPVAGLDVPAELLATIRTASAPPPA